MTRNEELMRRIQSGAFVDAVGIANDIASKHRPGTDLDECLRTMERHINAMGAGERQMLFERLEDTIRSRRLKCISVRMSADGRIMFSVNPAKRLPRAAYGIVIASMLLLVGGYAVASSAEASGIEFSTDGGAIVAGQDTWIGVTVDPWFMMDKSIRWSSEGDVVLTPGKGGVTVNVPISMSGGKIEVSATAKGGLTSSVILDVRAQDCLTISCGTTHLDASLDYWLYLDNQAYNPNDKVTWEVIEGSATLVPEESGYAATLILGADMAAGDILTVKAGICGSSVAATKSFVVDVPAKIGIIGQTMEAKIGETLQYRAICSKAVTDFVWTVTPSDHVTTSQDGDRFSVTLEPTAGKGTDITVTVYAGESANCASTKFRVMNELSLVLSCPSACLPGETILIAASVTPVIQGYDAVSWEVEGDVEWSCTSDRLSVKVPAEASKGEMISIRAKVIGSDVTVSKTVTVSQSADVKIESPDTLGRGSEASLYASVSPLGLADSLIWTADSDGVTIIPRGASAIIALSDDIPEGASVSVTATIEGTAISNTVHMLVVGITGDASPMVTTVIRTAEDLRSIGPVASGNYRLDSDLALGEWTPIQMDGVFDGNGHTLSGMSISVTASDSSGKYYGVFSKVNGEVRNLRVTGSGIYFATGLDSSGYVHAGIVAGVNNGTIRDVTVSDSWMSVNLDRSGCGVIAGVTNGTITGCRAVNCDVFSNGDVGGITGVLNGGILDGCSVDGSRDNPMRVTLWSVNNQRSAGGIAGYVNSGGIVRDSEVGYLRITLDGFVELKPAVGVIVGSLHSSTIKGMVYDSTKVSRVCDKQMVGWFLFICTFDYTENYYRSGWGYAGNCFGGCSVS